MTFHFFHINEVYSNADGSVQFIEFVGDADAQHEWAGHSIDSIPEGKRSSSYLIDTDLPSGSTNGKSVLVATQGFANLGIVAPDYIIPNGFLSATNSTINFPGMVGGTLTYTQLPVDGKLSLNRDGSTGINSPTNYAGNTGTVQSNIISGTEGSDNLPGTAGDDVILAADGQDTLNGGTGNDTLDGGSGADTAIYSSDHASYSILGTASGLNISGPDGNDTLSGVERIQFSDQRLAFDFGVGQAASNTVRIIGAAFDAPTIQEHPDYVGIGLNLFDAGQSVLEVSQLVVGVLNLADDAFVDTVYQNVFGTIPAAADHDLYVGLLANGSYTQAQLLELAANAEANATNINLIGLQQTGVAFV